MQDSDTSLLFSNFYILEDCETRSDTKLWEYTHCCREASPILSDRVYTNTGPS